LVDTILLAKQFEIRHQIPKAAVIGFLVNPVNPNTDPATKDVESAAERLGHKLSVVNATSEREIDAAIKAFMQERVGALFVHNDPFLLFRREQIVSLTAYNAIPAMYPFREFAAAGGLMSYGTDQIERFRLAGDYCGQILKGAKPADLPVQQSTKFEFVINAKTAKALGLEIPLPLLVAADEVIE
jgi:putative ABC transport system substrate-binding protein